MSLIAGALAGILSAWGVGGGTLLMIAMTSFFGLTQLEAQGINLLYFMPVSATALWSHVKNGYVDKRAAIPAAICGAALAAAAALAVSAIDVTLLKRGFGIFLIITGLGELFHRSGGQDR